MQNQPLPITTIINEMPQIQTVIQEGASSVTSIVNEPWITVTSVNGMTGDIVLDNGVLDYKPYTTYAKGTMVTYNNTVYYAKDNFTSGSSFNASQWQTVSSGAQKQANWNTTNTSDASFIQNKPTKLSQFTNDSNYVTATQVNSSLATKVDKVTGMGLSANDFTTPLKEKLTDLQDIRTVAGNLNLSGSVLTGQVYTGRQSSNAIPYSATYINGELDDLTNTILSVSATATQNTNDIITMNNAGVYRLIKRYDGGSNSASITTVNVGTITHTYREQELLIWWSQNASGESYCYLPNITTYGSALTKTNSGTQTIRAINYNAGLSGVLGRLSTTTTGGNIMRVRWYDMKPTSSSSNYGFWFETLAIDSSGNVTQSSGSIGGVFSSTTPLYLQLYQPKAGWGYLHRGILA